MLAWAPSARALKPTPPVRPEITPARGGTRASPPATAHCATFTSSENTPSPKPCRTPGMGLRHRPRQAPANSRRGRTTPPPPRSEDRAAPLRRTRPSQLQRTQVVSPSPTGQPRRSRHQDRRPPWPLSIRLPARMNGRQRLMMPSKDLVSPRPRRDLTVLVGARPEYDPAASQTPDHPSAAIPELAAEHDPEPEATYWG